MEQLYTIKEAAHILKVTKMTIYNWHAQGKIKIIYINDNPRITESELKRLMKGE